MWNCICDCGRKKVLRGSSLRSGTTMSCGCLKHDRLSINRDLVGKRFGRWVVLSKSDSVFKCNRLFKQWKCQCDCGTIRLVDEASLLKGSSKSCGCYRKEQVLKSVVYEDLTGQKFGHWTVLYRGPNDFYESGGRCQKWYCQCDCGTKRYVLRTSLKSGFSQSCGCINVASQAELLVKEYLKNSNFKFVSQKTYSDLIGVGGGLLSYDFFVHVGDYSYLIEVQGEQYYHPVTHFGGSYKFEIQQKHDYLKYCYAQNLGIKLVYVGYRLRTYNSIKEFLDMQLIKTEKR